MKIVSLGLVDASALSREGLKALCSDANVRITKEASSLEEAVRVFSNGDAPQIILIDPVGIGESGAVAQAIKAACANAKLVLLTGALDVADMAAAIRSNVDGYLMKDISPVALIQSLRLVVTGEKVFPSQLAELLISGHMKVEPTGWRGCDTALSRREAQILRCLLDGASNKRIANRLGITEATVKVHVKALLRKIDAANRTQAAVWALSHGFSDDVSNRSPAAWPA